MLTDIDMPILNAEEMASLSNEMVSSSIALKLLRELSQATDYITHLNEQLLVANRRYWDLKLPMVYREEWERKALAEAEHDAHPEKCGAR